MCQFNVETVNFLKLMVPSLSSLLLLGTSAQFGKLGAKARGLKRGKTKCKRGEQKKVFSTANHKRAAQ